MQIFFYIENVLFFLSNIVCIKYVHLREAELSSIENIQVCTGSHSNTVLFLAGELFKEHEGRYVHTLCPLCL